MKNGVLHAKLRFFMQSYEVLSKIILFHAKSYFLKQNNLFSYAEL